MKRFIQSALAALGGRPKAPDILNPRQFTEQLVAAFAKSSPGLKITIQHDLELKVQADGHDDSTAFLHNAYDEYKARPDSKEKTTARFVSAFLETLKQVSKSSDGLDRSRIVPIIKDRHWLDETRTALIRRGAKKVPENVYEDLNADLVIVYAEDSPKNLRYFSVEDLEKANIDRKDLRKLACENLKRLLPNIEEHGTEGLYMFSAGGDFEASLLLFDSIWADIQPKVRGDVVVAIPARDLLIATGSNDPEGIRRVKKVIQQASSKGAYRLTNKLFVYRDGKFDEFHG